MSITMVLSAVVSGVLLSAAVIAVMPAAPAWAHSRLLATTPADKATVAAPIGEVTLTFNEPVHQRFSVVVVDGPGGVPYSHGPVQVIDTTVHQPVNPLRSGSYTVRWRVVSADGHPVEGTFGFTVALPAQSEHSAGSPAYGSGQPTPAAAQQRMAGQQPSGAWWPWLLGLVVLAIGAVAIRMTAVRLQRRGRS